MYHRRLYFLREETYGDNKVKQKNLAEFIGISLSTYRLYESENTIFPLKHLNKVCEFYNVSIDYIFGFTKDFNYPNNSHEINLEKSRERIRTLRKNLKLTMNEFGKILECSSSNISDFESGRLMITTKKLYKLCKEYSVSADFILGKTDEPKRIQIQNRKEIKISWYNLDKYKFNYSEILKSLRKEKDLLQSDISNILNLEHNTYGKYENGSIVIPIKHLEALSRYFDVSIDYILGLSDIRKYYNNRGIDRNLSGKRLKELRKLNGYNQENFANELGTHAGTIAGYEAGNYIINTYLLCELCEKFNVSADYILGKVDEPSKIDIKE